MTETMPTSEVLNRAADLIEERGWEPGHWGWGGGTVWLEGGIAAAMGLEGVAALKINECPAGRAVREYLDMTPAVGPPGTWWDLTDLRNMVWWTPEAPLYKWNDAPRRTQDEVVGILRATALVEAAKENPDVVVACEAAKEREAAGVSA